ncbi:RAMP superfamily protein [Actinopolyspora xinjiangensis]|uniref:RAMP superfamily protein n=1 Tax=Actinopolyspora xinjiangensis TaxID=405564 RepID=A0A1H0WME6_9ACTN|nr:RAMP superfamily CRISPR-associated protein [Actinopolyspora xinjiangensis]SDP91793.1 RAMP superfamily protein [Actinopolyspora xinjiangensis]
MVETFVNPYTFVPLPDAVPKRSAPHDHSGRGDLLSGTLTVTITAETPLLVRGITADDEQRPRLPRRPDGTVMIPGSSLKGALRSLHETLAGGCLRVFDNEFAPGYRASANSGEIGTVRLAVVVSHDDEDSPPELELCEEGDTRTHRLHQNELLRLHSEEAPLTSGDRLEVTFDEHTGKPSEATRSAEGDWVVFLSDAGVRDKKCPYRAHIRKLPEVSDRVRVSQRSGRPISTRPMAPTTCGPDGALDQDATIQLVPHRRTTAPFIGNRDSLTGEFGKLLGSA